MCGIAGIVNFDGSQPAREQVQAMMDLIAHRGPDGEGMLVEGTVALGHRRLAILDLSDAGAQPMTFGDLSIVHNGEIYNYLEIKEELGRYGHIFHTHTDTEVILAAYAQWGDRCVDHFNGMWAFAILDRNKHRLFCSRDRFGIKPFYYLQTQQRLCFGSEIRQLLACSESRTVHPSVLADYLVLGLEEHTENTFFSGVLRLMPGHNMSVDLRSGRVEVHAYYHIRVLSDVAKMNERDAVQSYKELLMSSIRLRLRSDVPVGTCLSGGLDSSVVATLAAGLHKEKSTEPFRAITAKSTEKANDESGYAQMVAQKSNLDWRVCEPGQNDFDALLDEVVKLQEEPFGSPSIIMQYFVMKAAREAGLVVMLDGQGGDETLLGYERYYPAAARTRNAMGRASFMIQAARHSRISLPSMLAYQVYFSMPEVRWRRQRTRYSFVKSEWLDRADANVLREISASYANVQSLQVLELSKTQLPHLLRYEDRNSMHFAIESRLPYLDYRLVEFAVSLPLEQKIRKGWTKYALRQVAAEILPNEIAWRKHKFGFEAPASTWLQDRKQLGKWLAASDLVRQITNDLPVDRMDLNQLWRLVNLAKWERAFDVKLG
ncbi:MAG: asparagine synthase (glutamine-hydrolyzing) [Flavobacteriales bacterium]|nr:asparagine synthase (glutamine-hydrolyzing) [Flavobacteriales bacterium]MCB9447728.1 asparagine synthase (glutamine-hydrolyzing) [Flavobacteriales bacterium]